MTHDDLATLIGSVGVALLLMAFLLNLRRVIRSDGHPYRGLNVVGAGLACYSSYLIGFLPFVVLEGVWALVALAATARAFFGSKSQFNRDSAAEPRPILEVAVLDVRPGLEHPFEVEFAKASRIIASMAGYRSHELKRCVEKSNRYLLLVGWNTLEAHTIGFRSSPEYQRWKQLLHPFYDPFPIVEHYLPVLRNGA